MQNNVEKSQAKKIEQEADIVNLIYEDHKALKALIKVMKDSDKPEEERFAAFKEFAPTLIAHAKPEEETLYVSMKKNEELREDGFEGDVEHQLADQLVEEIKRTTDSDLKSARIKVLAELVEHHIEEEEEDMLPECKKELKSEERSRIGNEFLKLKLKYLAAGDDNIIPDKNSENTKH
ncbi:hemerythrin domain-containing protein [Bdellovibrio sp. HCB185ZH]|uniref:hemerythrin domain-containing protein n=1 Tax=Bdellovibrio sp. HCB185ZH TaxID=3394235 RepID=UPI0039A613B2